MASRKPLSKDLHIYDTIQQSLLSCLPRELRNEIYEHYVCSKDGPNPHGSSALALLRTCRALNEEAMPYVIKHRCLKLDYSPVCSRRPIVKPTTPFFRYKLVQNVEVRMPLFGYLERNTIPPLDHVDFALRTLTRPSSCRTIIICNAHNAFSSYPEVEACFRGTPWVIGPGLARFQSVAIEIEQACGSGHRRHIAIPNGPLSDELQSHHQVLIELEQALEAQLGKRTNQELGAVVDGKEVDMLIFRPEQAKKGKTWAGEYV